VVCALPRLYDEAHGTSPEPPLPGREELVGLLVGKAPGVLLAQLELHLQPALARVAHDLRWAHAQAGETFTTLDSREADLSAEVEVRGKLALGHRGLER